MVGHAKVRVTAEPAKLERFLQRKAEINLQAMKQKTQQTSAPVAPAVPLNKTIKPSTSISTLERMVKLLNNPELSRSQLQALNRAIDMQIELLRKQC